jgi:signal transduction histidine kinase
VRLPAFIFRRNRRLRPQHAVIALSVVLVLAYGASTFRFELHSYRQATNDAAAALQGTARSAEIGTTRSLFEIDAMLVGIERIVDTVLPTTALDSRSLSTVLSQFNEQSLSVSDILILNANGREVNRANPSVEADREYAHRRFFTAHHAGAPPALYIEAPEPGPAGTGWSTMMSRPLMHGGAIAGVIAVEVPIVTFTDFYDAIRPSVGTRITLLLDDGTMVASSPASDASIAAPPISAKTVLAFAANRPAGLIEEPSAADGMSTLRAFYRVPGRPLIISVSRAHADVLRQWYKECAAAAVAFLLFALTAAGLAWLAVRALRAGQFAAANLRRSEARLKRQSSLLQNTLDSIGEGLSVFDPRGRLIARNRRFCELLDLSADLAIGVSLCEILTSQANRGDFGDTELPAEVARRLEQFYSDVPTVKERITGSGRTLQIRRSAMPDGAVVTVYSDITELKAGETRLLQARSQAELANHSKSNFLANMSHELRTPLNAVIGFTEIISQELFGPIGNEKYLEYIKDVHTSSLHLLSIINDVLDMSKIEAGKLELQKEPVTLQNVIADVIRIVHERAGSRGIELLSELADEPVVIWADERAMKQIFLNLLSNAIKFSQEKGNVHIRVKVEQTDVAVIEVEDRGIGMDKDEQERALQPFGQAKPATTRNYGGTGLGLPITKGLVEAHGGTLTIFSRPGVGTTVRLALPIQPDTPIPAGASETQLDAAAG